MTIQLDHPTISNLDVALRREWLEANGLGGFASSTITGLNTRRYHGLLVAATVPPVGRVVLLSKLEETLVVGGERFELSSNRYPGVIHPSGYRFQRSFRLAPFPVFTYEVGEVIVEKSVFLVHGENTTVIEYRLDGPPAHLEVRPLIAFRDYHSLTRCNGALDPGVALEPGLASICPYKGLPPLHFAHDASEIRLTGDWYYNLEYDRERERGLDDQEDLFNPFALTFSGSGHLIASTVRREARQADSLRQAEMERRRQVEDKVPVKDEFVRLLTGAADKFLVTRDGGKTVIAGYPWFSDWGRDTMIALPGLTLETGWTETARSILTAFARHVDRGMIPNRFPDEGGTPEYNTVDATLWFFEAVRALLERTGDFAFVAENLYATLADIIAWHERGTRHGIRLDADGLLLAGEPGVQLTWMDAKIGDWVVTPRHGKAVEIQALWYNALRIMEGLALECGDGDGRAHYRALAEAAARSFEPLFWNGEADCLFDVVDGLRRDASIRPNQIFAVSLPHSMLSSERAARVVATVERELLTPYGLRSLAPGDPQYRARYEGDPVSRDSAYHQGTVWPWLLGPFITAYLKTNHGTPAAHRQAAEWLGALRDYALGEGLGQIPEVFDGDAPHRPGGCIAQAWSVAELLRAALLAAGAPSAAAAEAAMA